MPPNCSKGNAFFVFINGDDFVGRFVEVELNRVAVVGEAAQETLGELVYNHSLDSSAIGHAGFRRESVAK